MNLVPRPETQLLADHLEKAKSGCGSVVLISGEAGSGKTTLASEFSGAAISNAPDMVTALGNCSAISGEADPFHPFKQILQDLVGEDRARDDYIRLLEKLAPSWLGVIPVLGALAGAIVETGVEVKGFIRKGPQATSSEEMFYGFLGILKNISSEHPVLIVIDDLHWIDPSSASLIFYLARAISSLRILIICTYRPSEIALRKSHPARDVIDEIIRYELGTVIDLGGLSDHQIRALVDLNFPNNYFPSSFFDTLLSLSGGNALFVASLLESMKGRHDLLVEDNKAWYLKKPIEALGISENVQSVVRKRIDRLSEHLRDLCDIASVEGSDFTYEAVSKVAEQQFRLTDIEIAKHFRSLEKDHRVVVLKGERWSAPTGVLTMYTFIHGLFQELLYQQLSKKLRAQYHLLLADSLRMIYADQLDDVSSELAMHYRRANMPSMAGTFFYRSAANSRSISATLEAEENLIRAVESLEKLPKKEADNHLLADCIQMRAHVSGLSLRKFPEAIELYERCLRIRDSLSIQEEYLMDCYHMMGVCYSVLRNFQRAKQHLNQALELAEMLEHAGQPKKIDAELSPLANPPALYRERQGNVLRDIGKTFEREGHVQIAVDYYQRSLTLLKDGQDKGGFADTRYFIGLIYLTKGEFEKAEDELSRALANRQEGTKYRHTVTLNSQLAAVAFQHEKWDEGFRYAEEARNLVREHQPSYQDVQFFVMFAEEYLARHRYQDGFDTFAEAISLTYFADQRAYRGILNKILDVIEELIETDRSVLGEQFCDTLIESAKSGPGGRAQESVVYWIRAKEHVQDPRQRRLREHVFRHD